MPSKSSIAGAVGLAHQSGQGTPNTTYRWIPATSVNLNPQQNAQTLPAEVGGDYFLRGSYKSSAAMNGDIAFVARPSSLGDLFLMLTGVDTVTNPTSGVYQHTFTPFTVASGNDLPWYTAAKDVSGVWGEQHTDVRLTSLTLDIPKSAIMTGQASLVGITPQAVTSASFGSKTFDVTPQFQSCLGAVSLLNEANSSSISSNSVLVDRFSLSFNNNLSNDEFVVGSYYQQGITLLQKTVQVNMDFTIRDSALYQAVYYNGGSIPEAWSPSIYRGTLAVTLTNPFNIPTTSTPYSVVFNFPGLDFMVLPVALQGSELVRATLSTQVTLGTANDRFNIVLTNGIASY